MLIAATRLGRKDPSMVSQLAPLCLVFIVKIVRAWGVDRSVQRSTFSCISAQCFFNGEKHFSRSRGEPNSTDFIDYVGPMPGTEAAVVLLRLSLPVASRKIR